MSRSIPTLMLATVLMTGGCSPAPSPSTGASEPTNNAALKFEDAPVKAPTAPAKPQAVLNQPVKPEPTAAPAPAAALDPASPLLSPAAANEQSPAKYTAKLVTSKGDILIDVTRDWAPVGADRFYNLVKIGYFNDTAFFRVVEGFMAQIGIHGNGQVNTAWKPHRIKDDPPKESNTEGMVTFATSGKDSRLNQFFINFGNNARLDGMGFAPFGKVRDMTAVNKLYSGYGEGAPRGRGPMQARIQAEGNTYLKAEFPLLDYIVTATIE